MNMKMNPAQLDDAADELVRKANAIKSHLTDLGNDLRPLETQWEGSARDAYRAAQEEWNATMDSMIAILSTTADTVRHSKVAYQTRDAMQAQGFGA